MTASDETFEDWWYTNYGDEAPSPIAAARAAWEAGSKWGAVECTCNVHHSTTLANNTYSALVTRMPNCPVHGRNR